MASSKDDNFEIPKQPVHERDQIPSKLFGFTVGEIAAMIVAFFVGSMVWSTTTLAFATVFAVWGYIKYMKSLVPEDFFKNMIEYYRMDSHTFRASGRDYEWRAPIVRKKKASAFFSTDKD